jgi:YwiC-like protein
MSTPTTNPTVESPQQPQNWMANLLAGLRPTVSPEHGVYVVLLVSFLTGAAAAQHWTWATTAALICAVCGFQAEHPLAIQIRQRKTWKPRFLLWGSMYGGISGAIAFYLYWRTGTLFSPLLWIYLGAIVALLFDSFSIWHFISVYGLKLWYCFAQSWIDSMATAMVLHDSNSVRCYARNLISSAVLRLGSNFCSASPFITMMSLVTS